MQLRDTADTGFQCPNLLKVLETVTFWMVMYEQTGLHDCLHLRNYLSCWSKLIELDDTLKDPENAASLFLHWWELMMSVKIVE
jgi:hypothetical protein